MASANSTYGQKEASDQNFDYMFKILIIGNSSVGKTSFLFRYADDSFTPTFVSTVGIDFKVKTIYRNDKRIKLQIWVRNYRKLFCSCFLDETWLMVGSRILHVLHQMKQICWNKQVNLNNAKIITGNLKFNGGISILVLTKVLNASHLGKPCSLINYV